MKKATKFLTIIAGAALIAPICAAVPSDNNVSAVSLSTLNGDEMFFKQQGHYTCTLCANAMLLRRTTRILGGDWESVTESSCRGSIWYGAGMAITYSYNGINVDNERIYGPSANTLKDLLAKHPEGIVAYDYDYPHAILLTDYTNGKFYCADPANNTPSGRIEVTQSLIDVNGIEDYWYVTNDLPPVGAEYKINNNSVINAQKVAVGNKVTMTGAADGGRGGYSYNYYYKNSQSSDWKKYASGANASYTPNKEGKWYFRAEAVDGEGVTAVKDFTVTVNKKLALSVSADNSVIYYGDNINIKLLASGGASNYRFEIDAVKPGCTTVNLRKELPYSSFTYHPWEAGKYTLKVKVKDNMGNTASASVSFEVKAGPLENNSTIDKTELLYGESVNFKALPSGGAGGYEYKFTVSKPSGKTVVLRKYSSSSAYCYRPWEEGTYKFTVSVRDSMKIAVKKEFTFTVKTNPLTAKAGASEQSVSYGSNVILTTSAEGGTGGYEYKYYAVKPSGVRVNLKKFSSLNTITYHPWEKGTYTIEAVVRDSSGKTASEFITFTVV